MLFNEHQATLWKHMLQSIEDFKDGKLQYYNFVSELEGALDAGDFNSKELVLQWYDLWTPLEIFRAQKGNNVTLEDVSKYLAEFESFLRRHSSDV
jgi:hypothetical protein